MGMKIASFNVNSLRARIGIVTDWLGKERPDVLCLQETKVPDTEFPADAFKEAGYHAEYSGEKGYNGVAIISRRVLKDVRKGFNGDGLGSTRLISARLGTVSVVNMYAPQGVRPGSDKFIEKLEWFSMMYDYFEEHYKPGSEIIWLGDFNIAPGPEDVYDPARLLGQVGFHPDEHAALERVRKWGFVDVFRKHQPGPGQYTFWDYRVRNALTKGIGWRVDHIWATRALAEKSVAAWIDTSPRLLEKPSDHTPIVAEFKLR